MIAAVPDRTDGVDDEAGGQAIALGQLGVARFAAAQQPAFVQQTRAGGTMDRAVDSTAAEQR